jgi:hypothetical protein
MSEWRIDRQANCDRKMHFVGDVVVPVKHAISPCADTVEPVQSAVLFPIGDPLYGGSVSKRDVLLLTLFGCW